MAKAVVFVADLSAYDEWEGDEAHEVHEVGAVGTKLYRQIEEFRAVVRESRRACRDVQIFLLFNKLDIFCQVSDPACNCITCL